MKCCEIYFQVTENYQNIPAVSSCVNAEVRSFLPIFHIHNSFIISNNKSYILAVKIVITIFCLSAHVHFVICHLFVTLHTSLGREKWKSLNAEGSRTMATLWKTRKRSQEAGRASRGTVSLTAKRSCSHPHQPLIPVLQAESCRIVLGSWVAVIYLLCMVLASTEYSLSPISSITVFSQSQYISFVMFVLFLAFLFSGAVDWIQGLTYVRQAIPLRYFPIL